MANQHYIHKKGNLKALNKNHRILNIFCQKENQAIQNFLKSPYFLNKAQLQYLEEVRFFEAEEMKRQDVKMQF